MLRAMRLRTQLVLLQSVIMLVVILGAGLGAVFLQERQIRAAYVDRMVGVANSVAQLPTVLDAFDDPEPSVAIQPIAELIRTASNVTYVVVTDVDGIRFSHPNPERIGEPASTEPTAAITGEMVITTETGTLGTSWRVKVPVRDVDGTIIGQVSVGILEAELHEELRSSVWLLAGFLALAAVVGVLLSTWAASVVRRRIYGLEPDEIKAMLETRDATLHGIREGIVVVDEQGHIALCNDAAARLLDIEVDDAVGEPIATVLDADLDALFAAESQQQLLLAGERVLVAQADPVIVHGRPVGTVLILIDRTELDGVLRELAGAQSTAEGLRAQRHEFANTLHTLGGLIELGESDAALQLVRRVGDGGAISDADASGIHDLELAALVLAKRARARELGIALTVDVRLTAPFAADGADLVTVVGNLVDNAMEASAPQGVVRLTIDDDGSVGRILVEDDGPGVPEDHRETIFELGHSTKSGDRGRGYGLTLVHRVVRRLGGTVTADDSDLGGARLTVTLPLEQPSVVR